MSEIWNLEALCRCCHADGVFKSLEGQYIINNKVETYLQMLRETLGVHIKPPPANASFSICDTCISLLRKASGFKRQVLDCETKFEEYCKNELSNNIKMEPEFFDDNIFDETYEEICVDNISGQIKKIKDDSTQNDVSAVPKDTKIEISIDALPSTKKKPARKRIKSNHMKEKTKGRLKKPKEEESCVVKVKTETGEVFSCRICGITYENLDELNSHINEEHYVGYKCSHCGEVIANERRYRLHNANVHLDMKPFQCPHCVVKVTSKISLTEHINSVHTKERYFQCDECQKIFYTKQVLKIHLQKHIGTFTKLICDQCGVGCNDKTNLRIHILTVHEKIKLHACEVCGKRFTAAKHVKIHLRSHTGEKPFSCSDCDKKFTTREGMKLHQKIHDNSGYKCKSCDLVFPTRSQHIAHYKSHQPDKSYKCHLCDKGFAGKYSLNRHIFEHSGERPFACAVCKKTFKQKSLLARHLKRTHNPNKDPVVKQKCEVCKRTVPNIERHMLAHMNKPYACHLCDKKYPLRNALNRHLDRHTGRKPHMCDLCDKGFIQLRTLKKHKLKVHKVVMKTEQEDHYDSLVNAYAIPNLNRKL